MPDRPTETRLRVRSISEHDLVAALKRRDQQAMGALYDMYAGAVYGAIFRIVRAETLAEDAMQETFVKVWTNIAAYDPSRGKFFTWLINIARHQALDCVKSKSYRQSKQNQDVENIVGIQGAEPNEVYDPESIGVKELLDKLNPEQRDIVRLVYFEGYTHSEAAEHLDIPLGTVKTRLRAAITFFRKILLQVIAFWT